MLRALPDATIFDAFAFNPTIGTQNRLSDRQAW